VYPSLANAVGFVLVLSGAGCAHHAPDQGFEDRIALFATFAAALPVCPRGRITTVDELLASRVAPGTRVTVEGHPSPACTNEPVEDLVLMHSVPTHCFRHPGVWVLWRGPMPPATRVAPGEAPCVHVTPETLTEGIVLGPEPIDLTNCDWEAAERAAPALKVAVTGKLAFLSAGRPIWGAELLVENLCREP
jgi:hypothetical protein